MRGLVRGGYKGGGVGKVFLLKEGVKSGRENGTVGRSLNGKLSECRR